MANTLKGWLTDNTVTTDPNDKILVLESTGKADMKNIYEEMLAKNTGKSIPHRQGRGFPNGGETATLPLGNPFPQCL